MSEKTIIELKDNEAALVMSEEGEIQIHLPKYKNDDCIVSPIIQYIIALGILSKKDDELSKYVIDKFNILMDEFEEKEN